MVVNVKFSELTVNENMLLLPIASLNIMKRLNLLVNTNTNFQVITGTYDKVFNFRICIIVDVKFLEHIVNENIYYF